MEIIRKKIYNLILIVLYIRPNSTAKDYEAILDLCLTWVGSDQVDICIVGDFNQPTLFGSANPEKLNDPHYMTNAAHSIEDFCNFVDLVQLNKLANSAGNILDLCMVKGNTMFTLIMAVDILVNADRYHPPFKVIIETYTGPDTLAHATDSLIPVFDYKNADFMGLYTECSARDWSVVLNCSDPNLAYDTFNNKFTDIIKNHVPFRKMEVRTAEKGSFEIHSVPTMGDMEHS